MPARQQKLPGVGPQSIQEIEDKALELRELQAKRQAIAVEENKARQDLRDLLKKHGFKKNRPYQFEVGDGDGESTTLDVVLEQTELKAFVRKHKEPKDSETGRQTAEEENGAGD